MLLELINIFEQNAYVYYFDIPFDETLIRHSNRAKVNEFGEKEMRSWWNEKDYLGVSNERIITKNSTLEEVVDLILEDLGK